MTGIPDPEALSALELAQPLGLRRQGLAVLALVVLGLGAGVAAALGLDARLALDAFHRHHLWLLGFVAGEMLVTDPALADWMTGMGIQFNDGNPTVGEVKLALVSGAVGAVIVVLWGKWLARRQEAGTAERAEERAQAGASTEKSPNS